MTAQSHKTSSQHQVSGSEQEDSQQPVILCFSLSVSHAGSVQKSHSQHQSLYPQFSVKTCLPRQFVSNCVLLLK